ncbi:MAG: hypothetical protein SWH68_15350 [Thermodesulfobacteriota bacterium]|nr:hypothetical protein [Thermodesulfobacteriota bacterium]
MHTSNPRVFAVGECAATIHLAMENRIPAHTLHRQHVMTPYPTRESDLLYMLAPFQSSDE